VTPSTLVALKWAATQELIALEVLEAVEHAAGDQAAGHADHAAQVLVRRRGDVHARVGIVGPVDRHLVDAQPGALGEDQQLGVEEPGLVAHAGQQAVGDLGAHRLEAALRVAEAGVQRGAQQQVVGARDQLTPGAPGNAGPVQQAAADGQVAVPGDERRHQRQQRTQVGGEVDVHVGHHRRVAGHPGGAQGATPPLLVEVHRLDPRHGLAQPPGDRPGGVGAGVVDDGDPRREGELRGEKGVQAADRPLQRGRLVVDGNDHIQGGGVGGSHGPDSGRGLSEHTGGCCEVAVRPSSSRVGGVAAREFELSMRFRCAQPNID